jgi:hypothetical protein
MKEINDELTYKIIGWAMKGLEVKRLFRKQKYATDNRMHSNSDHP